MILRIILAGVVIFFSGCASVPNDQLYRDLGEMDGITRLIDEFVFEISGNAKLHEQFKETDWERFHEKLVTQVCELSGGPCVLEGDSMAEIHKGMGVKESEFNSLVENLMVAMDRLAVPVSAQNRLLAKLAPFHKDIVEQP
ncbi:hemoglobin [Oleiphilus messinensis]|uniref:Hemoglobin n=1 Tax=Oleiphilus messinensis TaxID=141451 RepID=A0A1Y0I5P7_9GAMM|nr:group 1 truncated hemoglobin [Oleiphilus messinensis]ARU55808.1 hemoglobin [Oleiphilus messinensis]